MEEFLFFILFALTTGSFMYVLTCTDTNSNSPLALIKRFIFKHTPRLLKILFGQRIFNLLKQVNDYFFYTNHSLVQILYVLVTGGGYATYLLYGLIPHFGNNPQVSHIHSVCGSALFLYCGYSYYQACTYRPGQITEQNQNVVVDEFKEYYDGILYKPSVECTTCKIIKPARSKHCRACNICVSKFDHHCIWIKQCVGQNNYKYFLKFIFVHALLCDYGCTVGVLCLHGIAQQQQLYTATYKNIYTNEMYKASLYQVSRHLFTKQPFLVFAVLLCALMGLSLTIFAIYHLSMIRYDRTTNERVKRSDFKSLYYKEMRQLQMIIKERPDKQLQERFTRLKQCWEALSKAKYLGVWKGLCIIFGEQDRLS